MKKRVYGSMLLLSLLGFSSCNNDLSESTSMVQEQSLMQERAESPLQSLAIRLAHVVTNPQVREFIKNEVSKQEDGYLKERNYLCKPKIKFTWNGYYLILQIKQSYKPLLSYRWFQQ